MRINTGYEREEINRRLPIRQVFDRLVGGEFNGGGFCRCPLHEERTASFKLFEKNNSFYCFGCGKGGDVIRLYAELRGMTYYQAMRQIDEEFALGVFVKKSPMQQMREATARERERREKQAALDRLHRAEDILIAYFKELRTMPQTQAVRAQEDFIERRLDKLLKHYRDPQNAGTETFDPQALVAALRANIEGRYGDGE